jgi:hypothetical protein
MSKVEADIDEMKTDIALLKIDVAFIKSNYVTKAIFIRGSEKFIRK